MRNLLFLAPLAAALNTERAQHGPLISLAVEAGQGCHPRNGPARGWCEVGFCDPEFRVRVSMRTFLPIRGASRVAERDE